MIPLYLYKKDCSVVQEGKYLYEIEIERIQSLMGCSSINEQVLTGIPFGYGSLKAYNWFSTFNKHDWLTFVDITSGLLGMFPTPVAPVLLGISLAACEADGALYLAEGDPYMGGLILSFCLVPLGEWIRVVPGAKSVISKGKQYVIDLLKKAKSLSGKKVLDTSEKAIIKEADTLIKSLTEKADEVAKLTQKYYVSRVISNIIKNGGKVMFGMALLISKMSWAVGRPFVQLGGIYYGFDEVYLALYGSDEEKLKVRYNSEFQELLRGLKIITNYESVVDQFEEFLELNTSVISENKDRLVYVDPIKKAEVLEEINQKTIKNYNSENKVVSESPPIDYVIAKKINPSTNKPYTINENQKGESVRKIQEMLVELGFEDVLKGYNENKKSVDGNFGENTFNAVSIFQRKNQLRMSGEVDSETLVKMKEIVTKK
jgi:hypothetical protein